VRDCLVVGRSPVCPSTGACAPSVPRPQHAQHTVCLGDRCAVSPKSAVAWRATNYIDRPYIHPCACGGGTLPVLCMRASLRLGRLPATLSELVLRPARPGARVHQQLLPGAWLHRGFGRRQQPGDRSSDGGSRQDRGALVMVCRGHATAWPGGPDWPAWPGGHAQSQAAARQSRLCH
jgi:hypothetical protein